VSTSKTPKKWELYENASREVLAQLLHHFGLASVSEKGTVAGTSGTEWEIDIVGRSDATNALVVVECRLTKSKQAQTDIAAMAFTMMDTGAESGIMITPEPLQKGAKIVAKSAGIVHFQLDEKSLSNDFLAKMLEKLFIGIPSIGDTSMFGTTEIRSC
jgi:Restriction endonuclease